jgi:pseudaminic acid biosynthesis-associated methylase
MDGHRTSQTNRWSSEFGKSYTDRNPMTVEEMDELYRANFGVTRTALNERFLGELDRGIRILEVGANVGTQLRCLRALGFQELYGIELQQYAVDQAHADSTRINLIRGSAFDVPFRDGFFDLVFTSGVLIHIGPDDIGRALDEIHRCSRRWIWGYEYYADALTEIEYRGEQNLMWKADYPKLYTERFPDLRLVQQEILPYVSSEQRDVMFLLERS